MKRTLLLVLLSIAVFGGAYFFASVVIPDPPMSMKQSDDSLTLPPPRATLMGEGVGPSEGLSFRLFDPKTNLPVAQVTIGTYRRTSERSVSLADVTVDVLIEGGAAARIYSPRGTVRVEPPAEGTETQIDTDALAAADQAQLHDVTLRWYADARDLAANRRPTITASVDNLIFDHTRFTLATSDTTIDGRTVLADDVPVVVEGPDYDFYGFGLRVEWDPAEQRPALIRVARGDRLIIKKPPVFSKTASKPVPMQLALVNADYFGQDLLHHWPSHLSGLAEVDRVVWSEMNRSSTDAIASAISVQDQAVPVTPYEITLSQAVRVEQAGETLLEADEAAAIVALASDAVGELRAAPADPPAETPKPTPQARPSTAPSTRPKPADEQFEPITVYWTGPLLVQPAADQNALENEDDTRLYLQGAPLIGRFGGSELRGKTLAYHRAEDLVTITAAPGDMVTLTDADGNRLAAPTLLSSPDAGTAQAVGAGYVDLINPSAATTPTTRAADTPTQLRWVEKCDFVFERPPGDDGTPGDAVLRQVDAAGDVTVESKQLRLRGDTLGLTLDTPAEAGNKPQLASVTAAGNVSCLVEQTDGAIASFESGDLLLTFSDGIDGPIEVRAGGGVASRQPEGELSGDRLTATLVPNDEGKVELTRLQVEEDVIVLDSAGRAVRGTLATQDGPGRPLVVSGTELEPAILIADIGEAKSQITSLTIVLDPATKSLAVDGAGQLESSQKPEAGGSALQRLAEWDGGFIATAQRVDINENVRIGGDIDAQTAFSLTVDTIAITLRQQDIAKQGDPAVDDPLGDIDQVDAEGNVRLTIQSFGAGESVLRSVDLRVPKLAARPATQEFLVPAPGQVLFQDHRPTAAERNGDPLGGFRGNMALGWDTELHYKPVEDRLIVTGRATVAVEPKDGSAFKLVADTLIADIIQPADEKASPDIRRVTADGAVVFNAIGLNLEAGIAIYDPATGTLTARGSNGAPVQLFDDRGVRTGQFSEVVYDVTNARIDRATELRVGG